MAKLFDTEAVLDRIKKLYGISKDKDIASLLGLSPQDFSNRKKRESLVEPIVKWGINENVNFSWLFTGQESPAQKRKNISDKASQDDQIPMVERRISPQNHREGILSNFSDSEMARQMNLDMIEIEELDRDHYLMLVGEIRGAARALRHKKMA